MLRQRVRTIELHQNGAKRIREEELREMGESLSSNSSPYGFEFGRDDNEDDFDEVGRSRSPSFIDLSETPQPCYIDLTEDQDEEISIVETRSSALPQNENGQRRAPTVFTNDPDVSHLRDQAAEVARSLLTAGVEAERPRRESRNVVLVLNDEDSDLEVEEVTVESRSVRAPGLRKEPAENNDGDGSIRRKITCPVCLDTAQQIQSDKRRKLVSTSCGHVFCNKCIRGAVQRQHSCPTCRQRLTLKQFHPLYL
eukprot:m.11714 g.11714  ORF g.11714 m.11714 type:complete len:253 (+) comp23552_c1_seq2:70-828(+)